MAPAAASLRVTSSFSFKEMGGTGAGNSAEPPPVHSVTTSCYALLAFLTVICGDKRELENIFYLKLARGEGPPQSAHSLAA